MMHRMGPLAITWVLVATVSTGQPKQTSVVSVSVIVERSEGSFPGQIETRDVTVVVDGVPRQLLAVEIERRPVSWIVLFDVSMSMLRGGRTGANLAVHDRSGMVSGMADGFINRLRPRDRVLLMRFAGSQGWTSGAWSENRAETLAAARMLLEPIDPAHASGPSPIWDAVASAAQLLESQPVPRAIVLVTDGHATANRLGVVDAAAEAAERGIPVFAMHEPFWSGSLMDKTLGPGEHFLRPLAARTGGIFRINDAPTRFGWQDPLPRYDHFIDAMHSRLLLRVDVSGLAPGRYLLEVRTTDVSLTAHAPAWLWVE